MPDQTPTADPTAQTPAATTAAQTPAARAPGPTGAQPEPGPGAGAVTNPTADQLAALQQRIGELATADPAVVRLNPTLMASLRRLRLPTDSAVDVVWRSGAAEVDVAVTTTAGHQARATGQRIQDEARTSLVAAGLAVGQVRVHVVEIEPASPVTDPADGAAAAGPPLSP